jgi:hypothetical protein
MSVLLALISFFLILVAIKVQVGHHTGEAKFAVTLISMGAALAFLLFASKVYFS